MKKALSYNLSGLSLQGFINIPYKELIDLFGEPSFTFPLGEEKVQTVWVLEHRGKLLTIYDYRSSRLPAAIVNWHIGGKDRDVLNSVKELLPNHIVTPAFNY